MDGQRRVTSIQEPYADRNGLAPVGSDATDLSVHVLLTVSGSIYLLDPEKSRLKRLPRMFPPPDERVFSDSLRRDEEWIRICTVERLEPGARAVFVLEPLGDPATTAFTTRDTTEVVWIKPAAEVEFWDYIKGHLDDGEEADEVDEEAVDD